MGVQYTQLQIDAHRAHVERQKRMGMFARPTLVATPAPPAPPSPPVVVAPPAPEPPDRPVSFPAVRRMNVVLCIAAQEFDIRVAEMKGVSRSRDFVVPRQVAIYICSAMFGSSLTAIGRVFNRDHSTVLNAIRKARALIAADENLRTVAERIEQRSVQAIGQ